MVGIVFSRRDWRMKLVWLTIYCVLWLACSTVFGQSSSKEQAKPHASAKASAATKLATITNSLGMELVKIPAGEFQMGSHESRESLAKAFPHYDARRISILTDERPVHRVRITRPFYLAKHELTIAQFKKFIEKSGYRSEAERDGTGGY